MRDFTARAVGGIQHVCVCVCVCLCVSVCLASYTDSRKLSPQNTELQSYISQGHNKNTTEYQPEINGLRAKPCHIQEENTKELRDKSVERSIFGASALLLYPYFK